MPSSLFALRLRALARPTALALAPLALLAGCGGAIDPRSDAPVVGAPPVTAVGGDSDAGAPDVPAAIPFADAFTAGDVACVSAGLSRYAVTLPFGQYQLSDCTFRITRAPRVRGTLSAAVVAPATAPHDDAWSVTLSAVPGAPDAFDVRVHRDRALVDWSTDALRVKLTFGDAGGRDVTSTIELAPAPQSAVVTFDAPRIAHALSEQVVGAGVSTLHTWHVREDGVGAPVVRLGESIFVEAPFTLAPRATVAELFTTVTIQPDVAAPTDACLFGDFLASPGATTFFPTTSDGHPAPPRRLDIANALSSTEGRCPSGTTPTALGVTGVLTMNAHLGDAPPSSRFALTLAEGSIARDLRVTLDSDANGAFAVVATNLTKNSLAPLAVRLNLRCDGVGSEVLTVTGATLPPALAQDGAVDHPNLPLGKSVTWSTKALAEAFEAANPGKLAACPSGRMVAKEVFVGEVGPVADHHDARFELPEPVVLTRD